MSEEKRKLVQQFIHLQQLLHRYQMHHFMSFGPFHNPHRGQGRVLSMLKMKPEMSQKELSYLLDMSKQSLAELLGKLEKNGFIEREPSEEDRRVSNIKLTEKGAEAAGEMNDEQPSGLEQVFDCLNEDELKHLSEYLQRMIQSLEGQFTDEGEGDLRTRMMERFADMQGRRGFGGRDPRSFGWGGFPGFRDGGFQDARHGGHGRGREHDRGPDRRPDHDERPDQRDDGEEKNQ
ncbi:MarR family winged helix-turn-helix transcriptional regulator [Paenibacillus thalictri]|uniref:MarR family transcriptional regulator n=1 Tax=Paenibacillus thalictri TaxID=2527873 RepID=A0A4V2J2Z0_9BACL|nr:MarR family transcriptional regulator [Paenibacillus thalictri]TBL68273.1 MarR family transcriptional regulator [Paenibacillus thalictri]